MLKAVIFDMDGVIIDSEPMHIDVVIRILKDHGADVSRDAIARYIGISNSAMWAELADEYRIDKPVRELNGIQHSMNIRMLDERDDVMVPGVPELLRSIKKNNLKTAIASSSAPDYIAAVIRKFNIGHYFDAVVSGEEVARGKPEPDIFLRAARLLGVPAGECVVIEDSDHGIEAAVRAGMKVIGFRNPNSGKQKLVQAHRIVDSIRQVSVEMMVQCLGE